MIVVINSPLLASLGFPSLEREGIKGVSCSSVTSTLLSATLRSVTFPISINERFKPQFQIDKSPQAPAERRFVPDQAFHIACVE